MVQDAPVGSKQLPILTRSYEVDVCSWEPLLCCVKYHAGNGNIRAKRYTREYEHILGFIRTDSRPSHSRIAIDQVCGAEFRPDNLDYSCKQPGVFVAEARLKPITEAFYNNPKECASAVFRDRVT